MYNSYQSVYVIKNLDTNRVKIGITENINQRVSSLSHASGCKLEVMYLTEMFLCAQRIENCVHCDLKEYRGIGEWFNIDSDTAINAIENYNSFIKENIQKEGQQNKNKKTCSRLMHKRQLNIKRQEEIDKEKQEERQRKTNIYDNINMGKYKRIEKGIYLDKSCNELYSISYKNNKWYVEKLDKIKDIE